MGRKRRKLGSRKDIITYGDSNNVFFCFFWTLVCCGLWSFVFRKMKMSETKNDIRVRVESDVKKYLSVYNKVVQAILQKGKIILWRRKKIHSYIQNGCANMILSLHQSIDEK